MSEQNCHATTSPKLSIENASNEPSTLEVAENILAYLKAIDSDGQFLQLLSPLGNAGDIESEINKMPLDSRMLLADNLRKMRIEDKLQMQLKNIDELAMEAGKTLQLSRDAHDDDGAASRELSEKTLLWDFEIALGGLVESSCMRYAKESMEVAQMLEDLMKQRSG